MSTQQRTAAYFVVAVIMMTVGIAYLLMTFTAQERGDPHPWVGPLVAALSFSASAMALWRVSCERR